MEKGKTKLNLPTTHKSSYYYGLYKGLDEKLYDSKEQVENEKFESVKIESGPEKSQEIKQNYGLMVIDQKKKLEDKVEEFYPELRHFSQKITVRCYNAVENGRQAGKNISIRKGIAGVNSGQIN